jgi:folylpolyglutamate synthase/dihydropteroate synthase
VTRAEEAVTVTVRGYDAGGDAAACAGATALVDVASADGSLRLEGVRTRLVGRHQADNMAAAVATALALRRAGWRLDDEAVRRGLEAAALPGRFQVLSRGAGGARWVLDGAHTAASAAALAETLRAVFPGQPLALVVAMASDKEHRPVLAALRAASPAVVVFTAVHIAGSTARCAPPGALAAQWQAAAMAAPPPPPGGRVLRCRELIQAGLMAAVERAERELASAAGGRGGGGVVVVTGSLHAAAEALRLAAGRPLG